MYNTKQLLEPAYYPSWIIAFDEAAKILNSYGVTGELFADDGNGLIGGKDIDYMAQRLNRVCRDLSKWGQACGLTFNASKTVAIPVSYTHLTLPTTPYV